ncbi:DNA repair protein RecO [bacterium]|nr:DNA repair protein RecO [bacterium]MBU1674182.1 DNA repair protein RecO [bacterium]
MSVIAKPVVSSRVIVLRVWPTGETSTVAALLSEEHGYVRVIAKGSRGPRSALRPLVQPGRLVEAEFGLQPGRDLQYLKGGQLLLDPLLAVNSLERTAYLLSALEIVERCRPSGVTETRLFDLCRRFLEVLSSQVAGGEAPLFYAFELALLRLQGTAPVLSRCVACDQDLSEVRTGMRFSPAGGGAICGACVATDPEGGGRPLGAGVLAVMRKLTGADGPVAALNRRSSREIGILLHGFLSYHLPGYRLPASLDLLRAGRAADGGAPLEGFAP